MKNMKKADLSWLENPEVFRVNRLDAHSDHQYFETEADKEAGRRPVQSLNGTWKFAWSARPADRPSEFYQEDFDDGNFGQIQVPGHIELQGYDKIHYINTMYPWEGHTFLRPPYVDWEYNPVGSYVKNFDLNENLCGKRVCISFQGVEEACYVWLNGTFIGYSEDSFTPSEFDLTDVVREKDNRLCVEVYKRSSAAWLEDQDFFRFSGIFREVYLYAKPEIHVEDLWVRAGLKEDYQTGTLQVEAKLSSPRSADGPAQIAWKLLDREGNAAASGICQDVETTDGKDLENTPAAAVIGLELPAVHLWSPENPYLYQLELTVKTAAGQTVEIVPCPVGFRRFEIREKIMLLNGKRLIINGVNRHEWNPRRGRSITEEDMRTDIEIFRKNNINAVRTSHYPNQSLWYQLCDENGILVMDETNLESHGSWQKMGQCEPSWNVPGSLPQWKACVLDRAASMVERDKNHPSILWWSCGNESYAGECILAMSDYFHEKDPSRVVHYEGVFWNREFDRISDVESRMYASPEEVRAYLEADPQKPYLLCEYMHDMGNSLGGMESYIRLLDEHPQYQGGFIWDFIDQAIYKKDADGSEVLGYGGDFNDRPTDYAFSGNGIVFADRTEKPAMQEVRYWYSTKEERERFDAENQAAAQAAAQAADEAIAAGARADKPHAGETASDKNSDVPDQVYPENTRKSWEVIHGDVTLGVKGDGFHLIFSYSEHGPVSWVYGDTEWIYRPVRPAFWRASTENDKGNGFPVTSAPWCSADWFPRCSGYQVEEQDHSVTIAYTYETMTHPSATVRIAYIVDETGTITVRTRYEGANGLPQLPLFGFRFSVPFVVPQYQWQGLSGETYPDRKKGGRFGIWEDRPKAPDYLVPQEYGCHMDTRWVNLCAPDSPDSLKITMSGQKPFHLSVSPYTPHELESALHKEELPTPRRTVVSILTAMRGVGGIDSWGRDVEAAYHVSAEETMEYEVVICRG